MIAEAAALPSVREAAQAVRRSLDRVRMSQRSYAGVRRGAAPAALTRARTDWGLAVLEWIEASVTLAAAEDARDPARAASESRSRRITVETGPARGRIELAWRRYQQVRRHGGPDHITTARGQWRGALVDWFQDLAEQRATEDARSAQARRPAPDQAPDQAAEQAGLDPPDRPSGQPGWEPARRPPPASRRGQPRHQPLAAGWTPARRGSGS